MNKANRSRLISRIQSWLKYINCELNGWQSLIRLLCDMEDARFAAFN